ncbi:SDR family NAD(P)-dependent oxidoreductase [Kibdelosporangium banguiense]|uniref:SDR family NAD(P)-dependent oxidoreductase n=1 Tax=Kibdelosporangium banguiense TaxID=1365924 RepID=UPI0035576575
MTGVSSGIGLATARRLLADGWEVTGLSRTKPPVRLTWIETDLNNLSALHETVSSLSTVDAIVHAAGFQRSARLGNLSTQDGEAMWRVHVEAASVLVDTAVNRMPNGARIVLIGSRTMTGVPGKSQYAATKAALAGLARSWAAELVDRAITVNIVAPGPTDTPMLQDPARAATPPRLPPMGRLINPNEIAGTVSFLLSETARSITGQTLTVCAGASL